MLKRKISDQLMAWKQREDHMALVVEGARQVGKTFAIERLGGQHYDHVISLNFELHPEYKDIFAGSLETDDLVAQMSLVIPGATFEPGSTLIFLDEIQACPQARTALKFFTIDGRFDVIASGSLLGIGYAEVSSFPVGYVDRITLHSLDFEEFLWARGIDTAMLESVRTAIVSGQAVPAAVNERLMGFLREYIAIGGMPRAVQAFIDTRNFQDVHRIHTGILADYLDDIAKYAKDDEKAKARAAFLSIPKQLAQENKKFTYARIERGGSARKYGGSLQWLVDAGITTMVHNLHAPELPLEGNARPEAFKVYMRDTGLLVAMLEEGSVKDIMDGRLGIYKGAVYENVVADMLTKAGREKLYYFNYKSQFEMDFIIRRDRTPTAVEVKSSTNRKSRSMQAVLERFPAVAGIKLAPGNVGGDPRGVATWPLYAAMWL